MASQEESWNFGEQKIYESYLGGSFIKPRSLHLISNARRLETAAEKQRHGIIRRLGYARNQNSFAQENEKDIEAAKRQRAMELFQAVYDNKIIEISILHPRFHSTWVNWRR